MKIFKMLLAASVLAFSSVASAALVEEVLIAPAQENLVIDFGTGIGNGGELTVTQADIFTPVVGVTGTNIFIGALNVEGSGTVADGGYTTNAYLNFTAGADGNAITIVGTVGGLGTDLMTSQTLLSGTFENWEYTPDVFGVNVFSGSGFDVKSDDLLIALGAPLDTEFEFFGFSLEAALSGNVVSTDIVNTAIGGGRTVVPVPAAVWLFGSGLIGLVGVARRKA